VWALQAGWTLQTHAFKHNWITQTPFKSIPSIYDISSLRPNAAADGPGADTHNNGRCAGCTQSEVCSTRHTCNTRCCGCQQNTSKAGWCPQRHAAPIYDACSPAHLHKLVRKPLALRGRPCHSQMPCWAKEPSLEPHTLARHCWHKTQARVALTFTPSSPSQQLLRRRGSVRL
jgi:hypothetical protein